MKQQSIKMRLPIILILLILSSCREKIKTKVDSDKNSVSFIDSLKSVCQKNNIDTFDTSKLGTDDFSSMIPMNKKLLQSMYPNRKHFSENSFFIYAYLPSSSEHLSLITYEKNYEGENYRVDYIDLLNIDSSGKRLDKIRLAAIDNSAITYEVSSHLNKDTLKVSELSSTETYADFDTLWTTHVTLLLNGRKRIDTLSIKSNFKVRKF